MKPFSVNLNHSYPETEDLHKIARSFYDKSSQSDKDLREAYRWFELDFQANNNYESLYYMAEQKLWGKGVIEDSCWAIDQLNNALEAGSVKAFLLLANLYLGCYEDEFEDLDRARFIAYRGISLNIDLAHLVLGIACYEIGRGFVLEGHHSITKHTFEEAKTHLKKAHHLKYPSAPYYLGLMHHNGYGFPKSDYYFLEYMVKAADRGFKKARNELIQALKGNHFENKSEFERFLSKHHNLIEKYKSFLN